jgi:serine/threonine-protein kinase
VATESAPASTPRRRFAGYEILAELGEYLGVKRYKATQLALHRLVVLNVLPAESAKKSMCAALFERQMNVFSTLRHENVVGAIEAGEFQGERYFVVEHVEGSTLRESFAKAEQWEVPRAVRVARDIGRALTHLEALKLVHREISPRAITLCEDGAARLVDFRRAKFLAPDAAETWSDATLGVALYTSPEVALGRKGVDARADIYSLGCVLYHLLAGRPPFYGKNVAVVLDALRTRRPRDPRWLRPDLPRNVVAVLDRCLRKPVEQRYPNAAALVADLDALLAGRAPAAGAPPGSAWDRPFDGKG